MESVPASLQAFAFPGRVPAGFRLGWRQAHLAGLSLRQIVEVAERWPTCREAVLRVFGMSTWPAEEMTPDGVLALLDVVAVAIGRPGRKTMRRLSRLPSERFVELVGTVSRLSCPPGLHEFFFDLPEPSTNDASDEDEDDVPLDRDEPVVALTKVALELEADGLRDVMDWTPGRILFASHTLGARKSREAKARLMDNAVAHRAGGADEKSWNKFTRQVGA